MRRDGRAADALRPVALEPDFTENPLASVLCRVGRTVVLCTVCAEESVPRFLQGKGQGWISAEYAMLPGATDTRGEREATRGRQSGRTLEIQRLVGRSLRAVADLSALGERTLWIDCDVLQADGGTRCASITGGYVALALAAERLGARGALLRPLLRDSVAAVSVGILDGEIVLDLPYAEDARADVDMNVVATGSGRLVEVQGTAEGGVFSAEQLAAMTALALRGTRELAARQVEAIARRARMSAACRVTLVLASGNPGKLAELRGLLADLPLELRSLADFPDVQLPEEGDDYGANALAKARTAAQQTQLPALADDSGIEVAGLGGAPGPRSARYGGPGLDDAGRIRHLLGELAGRPGAAREARFVCVAALALPGGAEHQAFGSCSGRVLDAPQGRGGFGYDPVFWSSELAACLAEVDAVRKAQVSHRARALRALRPWLEALCAAAGASASAR